MFYDPDLAGYVRNGLGLDAGAWLTTSLLANSPQLTSLTVNGSLIDDLTGISNLSSLTSLDLIPDQYDVAAPALSTLAPLSGLANLTSLAIQGVGISDSVLNTLPSLPALQKLDVRYNNLAILPTGIANLPRLQQLLLHGNSLLNDNPRSGLAALKGKLVDIDIAPDRPEIATGIADLAARLYYLPVEMLEYVTNTIVFQPYVGAMKGALATLQTKAGNDWDTNTLLAELCKAAGVTTRYVAGAIEVSETQARDYFGARDLAGVANILNSSGLGYDQYAQRFNHTWLEAFVGLPTTGLQAWVPLDGSWKFRDFRPGLAGILSSVPFDPLESDYLTNPIWQKKSTAEYYEAKVATWLGQNRPDLTIADVGYDGPIRQQSFTALPTALPYTVLSQPAEAARPTTIPAAAQYTVNIKLANGATQLFGASGLNLTLSEVALSRLTIDPGIAAGVARPVLRRDGVAVATAPTTIASPAATQLSLTISITAPERGTSYSRSFSRAADRYIAIGLDANQFSESLLAEKRGITNAQQLNQANGSAIDSDQAVGGLLDLAIAQYFTVADADEASLASLTSAVADRSKVALGIATSAASLTATANAGLQFPYLPADMGIDVPANVNGGFAIDASSTAIDLNRDLLLGYTNSALEGLVLEELTNFESVSTIKAFQLTAAATGGLANLVEINASNVANIATLLPGMRADIRNAIASTVSNGLSSVSDYAGVKFTALVPKNEVTVGGGTDATKKWTGVGYTLKCVTSDPAKAQLNGKVVGYIIHGAVGNNPLVSSGGATSKIWNPAPKTTPTQSWFAPVNNVGDPVNVANGNVYHEESDFSIPNLGVPLAFGRRYDSIHTVSGLSGAPTAWSDRGMGEGWSFTYSDRIEIESDGSNTVTWLTDSGLRLMFTSGASGYTNPVGIFGVLTGSTAAGFTWRDVDGNSTVFRAALSGMCALVSKSDRFGNGVKVDYTTGTNRIAKVSDLRDANRWLTFTYNSDARPHITAVADFTGRSWSYTYASDGRLSTSTAATPAAGVAAPVVRYGYHADVARRGLLASVTDPTGNATYWEYFANRRGFRVTDTEGLRHSFTFNLFRKQSTFIDERGNATRYSYDDQGNQLEVLQSDRSTERSTWSTQGLKLTSTNAYGATTSFAYDTSTGKVTSVTDPLGNVTQLSYTTGTFRDLDTIIELYKPNDASDDVTTKYTYDATGFLTSRVDDSGAGRLNFTTNYVAASGGRGLIQSSTSPRGGATRFTYNGAGQVLSSSIDSSAGITVTQSYSYDSRGNRLSQSDANGNVTVFGFDALGRKISETSADPDGSGVLTAISTSNSYDVTSQLVAATLNDGRSSRTVYDKRQRELRQIAPDGSYTLVSYDAAGNKASETDSLGRIGRYVYDSRNRLVAMRLPDGSTTRLRLDGGGRIAAKTDQVGATTSYGYDKLGRKILETQPDPDAAGSLSAPATAWGYDSRGNLQYVTPFFVGQSGVMAGASDRSTHYDYDALGRKTKETQADPDGTGPHTRPATSYGYDADGNLVSVTDPRGYTTSYSYDFLGRKVTETSADPDGTGPLTSLIQRFVYDRAGNLRFEVAPGGASEANTAFTTEHVYDALNRKISTIQADPDGTTGPLTRPTSTRSYNASGFLASSTDPLGRSMLYTFDKLGRVLTVTNALGAKATTTYDAAGNGVIATDALGRRTLISYDLLNRPLLVQAPRPDATAATPLSRFSYDASGQLIASTDPLGRTTWRQYDSLGRLIGETSPLGLYSGDPQHTTRTEYDSAGRVTATIDPLGRRTDTVYDNLGRKIRVLQPDAGQGRPTTHYGYDAAGNLRYSTDPRGAAAGDPGFTTWLFYDGLGRQTATVDALGPDWSITASSATRAPGSPLLPAILNTPVLPEALPLSVSANLTRNTYDNRGRLASSTNALARTTNYAYDNLGRLVAETAPAAATGVARAVSRYGYDAAGNRTSETDPLGFVTSYTYDALDRRTTVTDARGLATVTSYDARGNTLSVTDASGNLTRYSYDRLDRLIGETDALGALSSFAYDLAGNRVRQTDRLGRVTSFVYDAANRQVEERWQQAASGSVAHSIKKIYDAANQLLGVIETDTANQAATTAWQFSYDALGNRTKSRMAPGEIVQAPAFDGAPNPPGSLAATDATIDWDGDGKGERYDGYQITLAVGEQLLLTASSTAFDPVLILQKPSGGLATALFDDHSGGGTTARLLVTADVAGTWTIVVTSKEENATGSYDLQIVKDQNAIVPTALVQYDFSYDKAGNLLSTTENQAAVADVPIFGKAVTGLGVRTSYTIDALNRVTRFEQSNSAGAVSKRVNYTYRGDGSVSKISRFAGAGVNPIGTTTNSYDGMGRLTAISQAPSASAAISYGFSYDAASRMTSMTTPEGTSNFTLDATDQLLSASLTGEAYAYDSSGNRTSGGTITGTGNRLLFDGTYRYAYDAEGNRTAKYIDRDNSQSLSVNDTDVTSYGYDQRNRLVAVSHGNLWTAAQTGALANFSSSGNSLPGSDLELRYSYDFADRRIRRSIDADGMAGVGGASVFYAAYAGAIRALEIAQIASYEVNGRIEWVAGEVAQRNFYGNGVDEILAVELNGNTFWSLGDHQDSVRDIVAGNGTSRGQLVEHRQYDSFGKIVRRTTGPAASAPTTEGVGIIFGYAGRPLEARTGLSDNRARWYEPGSGKFINEDPSGFKGGDANLYRYVGNDPLDQVDPSGLSASWAKNLGSGFYGSSSSSSSSLGSSFSSLSSSSSSSLGSSFSSLSSMGSSSSSSSSLGSSFSSLSSFKLPSLPSINQGSTLVSPFKFNYNVDYTKPFFPAYTSESLGLRGTSGWSPINSVSSGVEATTRGGGIANINANIALGSNDIFAQDPYVNFKEDPLKRYSVSASFKPPVGVGLSGSYFGQVGDKLKSKNFSNEINWKGSFSDISFGASHNFSAFNLLGGNTALSMSLPIGGSILNASHNFSAFNLLGGNTALSMSLPIGGFILNASYNFPTSNPEGGNATVGFSKQVGKGNGGINFSLNGTMSPGNWGVKVEVGFPW